MNSNIADNLRNKILSPEKSVVYQYGSIVSREILKNNGGTITVFAFGRGQKLSEHKTPFDAMAYVIDGEAEIIISGNVYNLKKGDAVVMSADEPHSVNAVEDFKMALIMLKN